LAAQLLLHLRASHGGKNGSFERVTRVTGSLNFLTMPAKSAMRFHHFGQATAMALRVPGKSDPAQGQF
jgi:hypothetical protein